jgi:hypothetical protein
MKCHACNDTVYLYLACSMRRRLQEMAPFSTSTSEADTAARGTGNTLQDREEEDGMTRHNGQPELVRSIVHHTRRTGDLANLTKMRR